MAGSDIAESLESATVDLPEVNEVRGRHDAAGLSFALVVGRYHTELTRALAGEVIRELTDRGAQAGDIAVIWVPGSFEVPLVLKALALRNRYYAYLALGVVIEGETSHAASIVDVVTHALGAVSREQGVPVLDGIVAAPSEEVARLRCLPGPSCRGPYLARSAIETAHVMRELTEGGYI